MQQLVPLQQLHRLVSAAGFLRGLVVVIAELLVSVVCVGRWVGVGVSVVANGHHSALVHIALQSPLRHDEAPPLLRLGVHSHLVVLVALVHILLGHLVGVGAAHTLSVPRTGVRMVMVMFAGRGWPSLGRGRVLLRQETLSGGLLVDEGRELHRPHCRLLCQHHSGTVYLFRNLSVRASQ